MKQQVKSKLQLVKEQRDVVELEDHLEMLLKHAKSFTPENTPAWNAEAPLKDREVAHGPQYLGLFVGPRQ